MNPQELIDSFYRIFGQVVLLPIPLGTKKPQLKGWQKLTFEDSRAPAHREKLKAAMARGGNIGILLGKASGGLMAIDLDGDDYADSFLELNPQLANTTRTRGKKGCQLWVRTKPGTNYPNGQGFYALLTHKGEKFGEWRCAGDGKGAQSVIFGQHPEGPRYQIEVEARPLEIDFQTIRWPSEVKLPWEEEEEPEKSEEELAADAVCAALDAYYDQARKEYALREGTAVYQSLNEGQFKRVLRFRGLSGDQIPRTFYSQLDIVVRSLQQHRYVNYVGPLAGRDCGYYLENEIPFLVTTSPKIIEPVGGRWATLGALFNNLFWGADEPWGDEQQNAFYGWLSVAYKALRARKFQPGQALAFAGTVEAGKSLTQKLVTEILGGRAAKAALFLQGRTDFNSELFGAEHLMLEDENASTSYAARQAFSSSIKSITSNQLQPCHAKGRDIINLAPWWRVTISLNDRPERMLVLPSLEEDIAGKIILLRATAHEMPMPAETPEEKERFWRQLKSELPAFLHWLLNKFEIPAEWRNTRFGIREWHHPTLLGELEELSPAVRLLELIDLLEPWGKVATQWEGSAAELRSLLVNDPTLRRDAEALLSWPNACGQYLSDLARIRKTRVKALRDMRHRWYEIWRPV
jgi:hypothetical protein